MKNTVKLSLKRLLASYRAPSALAAKTGTRIRVSRQTRAPAQHFEGKAPTGLYGLLLPVRRGS
jgi:hypothetical protein